MGEILLGLQLMVYGLTGVFTVLFLFYIILKLFIKFTHKKQDK